MSLALLQDVLIAFRIHPIGAVAQYTRFKESEHSPAWPAVLLQDEAQHVLIEFRIHPICPVAQYTRFEESGHSPARPAVLLQDEAQHRGSF